MLPNLHVEEPELLVVTGFWMPAASSWLRALGGPMFEDVSELKNEVEVVPVLNRMVQWMLQ